MEFGIKSSLLYKWRKDYQEYGTNSFPGKGNLKLTPEQERIVELEKRVVYQKCCYTTMYLLQVT